MSRLTRDEISFFKREGYLVKKGVLDPDLMARARERKWEGAPPSMKRDDPSTWFGPWPPEEVTSDEQSAAGAAWTNCVESAPTSVTTGTA